MKTIIAALLVALAYPAHTSQRSLAVKFTASAEAFRAATDEYTAIWSKEGERIAAAMERATGLRFEEGPSRSPSMRA